MPAPEIESYENQLATEHARLSPTALKHAASAWAAAVARETGKDDGAHDLAQTLKPIIERLNARVPAAVAALAFNELSEAVESQFALAKTLNEAAQHNRFSGSSGPLFTDKSYPETSWVQILPPLTNFLKAPLTPESTAAFLDTQPNFPPGKIEQYYQSYWALPNRERGAFLGKTIGLPADAASPDYKRGLRRMGIFLLPVFTQDFLPKDDPAKGRNSAHQLGMTMMQGFFMSSPPPRMVMDVAASLLDAVHDDLLDQASAKPRTTDEDERFGYRLGKFTNNLGSGAAKVTQFGHSLPITPDAWMAGLAGSKTAAGRPSRFEYLNWLETSVPENIRSHITHVGAHKGTGSYLSTYGIELDKNYVAGNKNYAHYRDRYAGKELVLSLKKPHAREDALEFMEYFLKFGEKITTLNPEAEKSVPPLLELIKQSIGMVKQETDLNHSARQEALASQIYENLKITAGSHLVDYYTQGAFDYGNNFRVSLCVDGKHFNELPESSASEKAIKRRAAVALFSTELYVMLSGRPFDHDRHGDNQGVAVDGDKLHVGNFDSGAMALVPPTKIQKEMFTDCLINAIANSVRNKYGVLSSLKHTIGKMSKELGPDRQDDLDYINSMMRAAVSLGDYTAYMKPRDYEHAFLAVAETGDLDPVIVSRLATRVRGLATTQGDDFVGKLPVIGTVAGIMSKITKLLPSWTGAEKLIAFEKAQAALYYPDNPNPNQKKSERGDAPAQEQYEPVKVWIESEAPPTAGFAQRALSSALAKAVRAFR